MIHTVKLMCSTARCFNFVLCRPTPPRTQKLRAPTLWVRFRFVKSVRLLVYQCTQRLTHDHSIQCLQLYWRHINEVKTKLQTKNQYDREASRSQSFSRSLFQDYEPNQGRIYEFYPYFYLVFKRIIYKGIPTITRHNQNISA